MLVFALCTFSNCYVAVYYGFEQWLESVSVAPVWRGILLSALFCVVMLNRPAASIVLIKASKTLPMLAAVLVTNLVLCAYQFMPADSAWFVWILLTLRLIQGFFLAIFSACSTSLIVRLIPPGQSARGFALFSLTFLLPFAVMPTLGEYLLPIVGSEPELYAWTTILGIPCLIIVLILRKRLAEPDAGSGGSQDLATYRKKLLHGVAHSGLGLIFASIVTFGLCTSTGLYFIKGLCRQTGADPALFFLFYTVTIMLVRLLISHRMDQFPRYKVVPLAGCTMCLALLTITWGPMWAYIPATILYGASISMIYPLQASLIYDRSTQETRTINSNIMLTMFDAAAMTAPLLGGTILSAGFDYHAVIMMGAFSTALSGVFYASDGLRQHMLKKRQNRS